MTRLLHLQRQRKAEESSRAHQRAKLRLTLMVVGGWTCFLSALNFNSSLSVTTSSTGSNASYLVSLISWPTAPSSFWGQAGHEKRQLLEAGPDDNHQTTTNAAEEQETRRVSDAPQVAPTKDGESWRGLKQNRTIAFVHVGKAGGITIRGSTGIACQLAPDMDTCIDRRFDPTAVLSRQTRYVFHMHALAQEELEKSTSFLFNLRNPVDRLISIYRYSHPGNCNEQVRKSKIPSYGCELMPHMKDPNYLPAYKVYPVFGTCFPNPAMEQFAQSVLTPYPPLNNHTTQLTAHQQWECRKMAYNMVQGVGEKKPFPHMYHNYGDYYRRTIEKFPRKEVFVVRTEREWDDLKDLDVAIGGAGKFQKEGEAETHGSQHYLPSPLSTEAYQKLCCVLENDIVYYQEILSRAVNLDGSAKQQCMDDIKTKCGITTSWQEWRQQCKARLKKDSKIREEEKIKARSLPGGTTKSILDVPSKKAAKRPVKPRGNDPDWTKYKNRTIAFVHVGKAGGITVRGSTTLACSAHDKEDCVNIRYPRDAVLSRQVKYVFHMHDMPQKNLEEATSLLFNVRNPVDRIISTYRYSHPANCNNKNGQQQKFLSYGCDLVPLAKDATLQPYYGVYPAFNTCFPLPAMEQFAQSVLTPYTPFNNNNATTTTGHYSQRPLTPLQEWECRKIAYSSVRGFGIGKPFPHMLYNYGSYMKRTMEKYPNKEVFAIRTEHEWEDLKALDVFIGGAGKFKKEGQAESHGSQFYAPSPVSQEAYEKLCCVLETEMTNYMTILDRAVNLDTDAKEEAINNMKRKCGITSFQTWQQECKARLRHDAEFREQERLRWVQEGIKSNYLTKEPDNVAGM